MIYLNQLERSDIFISDNNGTRRSEELNRFSQVLRKVPFCLRYKMPSGIYKRTKKQKEKIQLIAKQKGFGKWMKGRSGNKSNLWKGGRKRADGYILIYKPNHPYHNSDKYVYEHRLIMENYLGRVLKKGETVHHIDGNPSNNKIENFILFSTQGTHRKFEMILEGMREGEIIFDGRKIK